MGSGRLESDVWVPKQGPVRRASAAPVATLRCGEPAHLFRHLTTPRAIESDLLLSTLLLLQVRVRARVRAHPHAFFPA